MKELIDMIKREPGKYSVGSPGAGTTPSLSIEMLKLALNPISSPCRSRAAGRDESLLGGTRRSSAPRSATTST
jgi:hypothetical protein